MTDAELLKEAKERYKEVEELWRENRKKWIEAAKFRAREQWPEKVKKAREDAGRPCLVVDKLEQYVRQVVNDGRQNRPAPKVSPVDDEGDVKVAEAFKGRIRSICNKSNADQAFDTALDHAAGQGFGFIRLVTHYEHDRTFNQELGVRRVRNPMSVMLSRHQEADGSDAEFGFVEDEIRKEAFKKQYPKAKVDNWKSDGYGDGWSSETHVRICEYFYKVEEAGELYLLDDGTTCTPEEYAADQRPAPPPEGQQPQEGIEYKQAVVDQRPAPITTVKWCRFSGCEVLEKNEWPGKFIPIIPVYGVERDINGKVTYEGLVQPAMDPQRLYNYSRSGFAEHVSLSTKVPWVAAAGQLEGFEDDWKASNTENIAVLSYNPVDVNGTPVPPPQRPQGSGIPTGLAQDMQLSEHDIQGSLGMYNASLGEKSNEKSGVAIRARDRQSDVGTFHYHDNLNRAIAYLCRQLVDAIPKVQNTRRTVQLMGEDGKPSIAMIDPTLSKPYEKRGEMMVYNLGAGEYHVEVEAGPSYTTKRQEAAEGMMQLVQSAPETMQFAGDLIVRNMDWPGAEELSDRYRMMLPPPIQQALQESDGQEGLPPQVKSAIAQVQQGQQEIQQQQQQMAQVHQELQQQAAQNEAERAKLDASRKELQASEKVLQSKFEELSAKLELQAMKAAQVVPPTMPPGREEPAIAPDSIQPAPAGFFTPEVPQ